MILVDPQTFAQLTTQALIDCARCRINFVVLRCPSLPIAASCPMVVELKKTIRQLAIVFSICVGITQGWTAPFVNLDFELASTNNLTALPAGICVSGVGTVADLLPGWTISTPDFTNDTTLNLNATPVVTWLDSVPRAFLISRGCSFSSLVESAGNYFFAVRSTIHPLFISQIGDIPSGANELRILVINKFLGATALRASLNGDQVIDYTNFAHLAVIKGDISRFSGVKDVKLDLEVVFTGYLPFFTSEIVAIDNVEFATAEKPPPPPLDVPKPFQNLDFDTVNFVPIPRSSSGSNAVLPGWVFYFGAIEFTAFDPSGYCSECIILNLLPPNAYNFKKFAEGAYAVYLSQNGSSLRLGLSQTGTVPPGTKFLRFKVAGLTGFIVTLDGEVPPLVDITHADDDPRGNPFLQDMIDKLSGTSRVYDISKYAGKNVELWFGFGKKKDLVPGGGGGDGVLDSIEFLPEYARFNRPTSSVSTNGFNLSWLSSADAKFQVEFTTNFPALWQPVGTPVTSTSTNFFFTDTSTTNQASGQRIYRLRVAQ